MGHVSGGSGKGLELDVECDAGGRDFEVLLEATERNDSLENSCVGSSEFLDDITVKPYPLLTRMSHPFYKNIGKNSNVAAPILQEPWKEPQRRIHPTRLWNVRISESDQPLGKLYFQTLTTTVTLVCDFTKILVGAGV
ncbi:hypothetical protein CDAR_115631 [Caerostris darwini]|uniref:Uncharacterized protein n=1 Tax=Caerostris darwini TaxID=1538125 RepID=A0AAV4PYF7_9ARAC|nr:hypothetical protein CDAR_115631 [Caerostris darwini]